MCFIFFKIHAGIRTIVFKTIKLNNSYIKLDIVFLERSKCSIVHATYDVILLFRSS